MFIFGARHFILDALWNEKRAPELGARFRSEVDLYRQFFARMSVTVVFTFVGNGFEEPVICEANGWCHTIMSPP